MGVIALPARLQRWQHLAHHGHAELPIHAILDAVELPLVGTAPDAELEPPPGQQIKERGFTRELDGVPVRRDHHRGSEADPRGAGRPVGEELKRAGRDGHLEGVVLRGPGRREASLVRQLHQLGDMS